MKNWRNRFKDGGLKTELNPVDVFTRPSAWGQIRTSDKESGFVLVLAVIILLVITLLGIWALRTSTFELDMAGSAQQIENQRNLAEGGANNEAGNVGFTTKAFYQVSDPTLFGLPLTPTTATDFNPGNYTTTATFGGIQPNTSTTWPFDNLLRNYNNNGTSNQYTYQYLVTYLLSGPPPMGNSANSLTGYYYRIQGAPALIPVVVEVGAWATGVPSL